MDNWPCVWESNRYVLPVLILLSSRILQEAVQSPLYWLCKVHKYWPLLWRMHAGTWNCKKLSMPPIQKQAVCLHIWQPTTPYVTLLKVISPAQTLLTRILGYALSRPWTIALCEERSPSVSISLAPSRVLPFTCSCSPLCASWMRLTSSPPRSASSIDTDNKSFISIVCSQEITPNPLVYTSTMAPNKHSSSTRGIVSMLDLKWMWVGAIVMRERRLLPAFADPADPIKCSVPSRAAFIKLVGCSLLPKSTVSKFSTMANGETIISVIIIWLCLYSKTLNKISICTSHQFPLVMGPVRSSINSTPRKAYSPAAITSSVPS